MGSWLIKLSCRQTGLDCDYLIQGETEEKFLAAGAEHAIKVHGLSSIDLFHDKIPGNYLCHFFGGVIEKEID